MVNFINVNQEIRDFLTNVYMSFYNNDEKDEASVKYFEFIEDLKNTNEALYNVIVGLCFVDNYRLLLDKKKHNKTKEKEEQLLEIYAQINDLDDLVFAIEEDSGVLSSIIYAPIKINHFNIKGKATVLNELDDEYVAKFNRFNYFEKYNIFKDRTVEEFIFLYLSNSDEEKKYETVYSIISILDLLYNYNLKNFFKLVVDMIKVYYRFKKVLQYSNPELTFGIDEEIINLIESKSLNDIVYELSCSTDMLAVLVEDFLNYSTNDTISPEWVNNVYKKIVSQEVKIKLKEA